MNYKINFEKIKNNTGREFENMENIYYYISCVLDVLRANNKNYTKQQYYKILDLWEIFNAIEIED